MTEGATSYRFNVDPLSFIRVPRRIPIDAFLSRFPRSSEARDLLIYIHIPFCASKCLFCDWVARVPTAKLVGRQEVRAEYVRALRRQIEIVGPRLTDLGYHPRFVYWGGGTPSRLEAKEILAIARSLARSFDLTDVEEHSLEASPDTLSRAKLEAMRVAGVNRLSIGVQSFSDDELKRLARVHDGEGASRAVRLAADFFENLNIDLIIGTPGQTDEELSHTLRETTRSPATHVSAYIFRRNERTVINDQVTRCVRVPIEEDAVVERYNRTRESLVREGLGEYATCYFAKSPQHRFRAEEYYFQFGGDYVGLGAGAQSLLHRHYAAIDDPNFTWYLDDPISFSLCFPCSADSLISGIRKWFGAAMTTACGIRFDTFRNTLGFDFSNLEHTDVFRSLLEEYEAAGGEFVRTTSALALSRKTRSDAYVRVTCRS